MSDELTGERAFEMLLESLLEGKTSAISISNELQNVRAQLQERTGELSRTRHERQTAVDVLAKREKVAVAGEKLFEDVRLFRDRFKEEPMAAIAGLFALHDAAAEHLDPDHLPF